MSSQAARATSIWWLLGAILLVGFGTVVYLKQANGGAEKLPVLGRVPDARFVAQDGRPFALSELTGRVWVADLIFTTCSGPCLRMTSLLYQVQEALAGESGVQLVSISVDPARDTPERLAWYAAQAHAELERWVFLTAPMETVRPLAIEGLKLVVAHNVEGEQLGILHSDRLVLVDQALQIRGYYDGLDPASARTLTADIRSLLGSK